MSKENTKVAALVILILGFIYPVTLETALAADNSGAVLTTPQPAASALSGRLFDGLTNIPIADGYVFALSSSESRILGWSKTLSGRGPDSGRWQIAALPSSGDVLLVGFHPSYKSNMAIRKVALKGQYQDIGILMTHVALHSSAPSNEPGGVWNLLTLAGWIAQEVNSTNANQKADELAGRLLDSIGYTNTASDNQEVQSALRRTCAAAFGPEEDTWKRVSTELEQYDKLSDLILSVSGVPEDAEANAMTQGLQFVNVDSLKYQVMFTDLPSFKDSRSGQRALRKPNGTLETDVEIIFKALMALDSREYLSNIDRLRLSSSMDKAADLLEKMLKLHAFANAMDTTRNILSEVTSTAITHTTPDVLKIAGEEGLRAIAMTITYIEVTRFVENMRQTVILLRQPLPQVPSYSEMSILYAYVTDFYNRSQALARLLKDTFPGEEYTGIEPLDGVLYVWKELAKDIFGKFIKAKAAEHAKRAMDLRLTEAHAILEANKTVLYTMGAIQQGSYELVKATMGSFGAISDYADNIKSDEYGLSTAHILAESKYISRIRQKTGDVSAVDRSSVVIILDTSGSMGYTVSGGTQTKLDAAKQALRDVLQKYVNRRENEWALMVYDDTETPVIQDFTPEVKDVQDKLPSLQAINSTPLARSLYNAAAYLRQNSTRQSHQIILLSDGEDTLEGDPVQAAKDIQKPVDFRKFSYRPSLWDIITFTSAAHAQSAAATRIRIDVVGFDIKPASKAEEQLQAIAQVGGGGYYTADTLPELNQALHRAFKVFGGGGSAPLPHQITATEILLILFVAMSIAVLVAIVFILYRRRTFHAH